MLAGDQFNNLDAMRAMMRTVAQAMKPLETVRAADFSRLQEIGETTARIGAQVDESLRLARECFAEVDTARQSLLPFAQAAKLIHENMLGALDTPGISVPEARAKPPVEFLGRAYPLAFDVLPAMNTIADTLSRARELAQSITGLYISPSAAILAPKTIANMPEGPSPAYVADAPLLAATVLSALESIIRAVGRVRMSRDDWILLLTFLSVLLAFLTWLGYTPNQPPPTR